MRDLSLPVFVSPLDKLNEDVSRTRQELDDKVLPQSRKKRKPDKDDSDEKSRDKAAPSVKDSNNSYELFSNCIHIIFSNIFLGVLSSHRGSCCSRRIRDIISKCSPIIMQQLENRLAKLIVKVDSVEMDNRTLRINIDQLRKQRLQLNVAFRRTIEEIKEKGKMIQHTTAIADDIKQVSVMSRIPLKHKRSVNI